MAIISWYDEFKDIWNYVINLSIIVGSDNLKLILIDKKLTLVSLSTRVKFYLTY